MVCLSVVQRSLAVDGPMAGTLRMGFCFVIRCTCHADGVELVQRLCWVTHHNVQISGSGVLLLDCCAKASWLAEAPQARQPVGF